MADPADPLHEALLQEDPVAMARSASRQELTRLKEAEEVLELRHDRKKRSSRLSIASQTMVGLVAVGGFFANAYQSYMNKQQQQQQSKLDKERWEKEFQRAQQADKYRAFFETSVLATDPSNSDKRLVGYALLQEFVQDGTYNSKATLMLEESLLQELRRDTNKSGLDEEHRNAVVAILTALAQTSDCGALEKASRSIDKIAAHHAKSQDAEEAREVFEVYVRRLVGRAAQVCTSMKDFRNVRRPLRNALQKVPAMGGVKGPLDPAQADALIARTLKEHCETELSTSGGTDCADISQHYAHLCSEALPPKEAQEESAACQLAKASWSLKPAPQTSPSAH